jgi:hypothetical protein
VHPGWKVPMDSTHDKNSMCSDGYWHVHLLWAKDCDALA